MEADAAGLYGNPAPRTGLAGLDMMNTGDAGHGTYYVAGLAYWAHTQPLRADAPALRIGHSVVALGTDHGGGVGGDPRDSQLYLAAKYGGFADDGEDGNPFDAGVGAGVGRTALAPASQPPSYAAGDDPAVLLAGLRAAFAAAAAGASGAGTSLMVPPDGDEGGYLFQSIGSGDGSARLVRRAFDTGADGVPQTGALLWQARLPVATQRKIFTLGVAAGREGATVPFEWAALTEAQRDLLDRPPAATSGTASASSMLPARDGLGEARLNAVRAGPLGESPHAAPLLVGAPSRTVQGAAYAAYYLAAQARRRVVYLGANDGMLHAFDAAGGAELFAYVPNALMGSLNVLAGDAGISASGGGGGAADTGGTVGGDTSAVASGVGARPAYVDGAAGAGEAQIGGLWKSVVVSGMGGGAQGVFALDAGDPEYFGTATGALWEFTDADDPAIGNVLAAPQIARLNTAAAGKLPVYRYFAVVASGLNNYVGDGKGRYTSGGDGALFLLALDKAPAAAWARGVNYYKFSAPMTEPGAVNGLGPPALVAGVDGALRFAYAGDLQGNLWRFDFGGAAPWSRAAGKAIFVARDDDGRRQPITARPAVVFAAGGAYQILFGTGQWIADADADDNRPQSFYAIRDAPDNTAGVSGRDALAKRTLAAAAGAGPRPGQGQGASATLILSGDAFRYTGLAAKQGWYLDFLDGASSGERSVGDSTLAAGKVFFNTLLPGGLAGGLSAALPGAAGASHGSAGVGTGVTNVTNVTSVTSGAATCAEPAARSYIVDVLSGFAAGSDGVAASGFITGWETDHPLPAPPVVVEMLSAIGPPDATGGRTVSKQLVVLYPPAPKPGKTSTPGSVPASVKVVAPARAGRISWREVANWRELHDAVKK
jgi:type IV pilus assembly protein PilY1